MIVIKITSQNIQTSGDNYGASYIDIQKIEFIEIANEDEVDKILQEEQLKSRGKAKFVLVECKIIDVPLLEPVKNWQVSVPGYDMYDWETITVYDKTKTELIKHLDKRHIDYEIQGE